jgi:hypothetical protein
MALVAPFGAAFDLALTWIKSTPVCILEGSQQQKKTINGATFPAVHANIYPLNLDGSNLYIYNGIT